MGSGNSCSCHCGLRATSAPERIGPAAGRSSRRRRSATQLTRCDSRGAGPRVGRTPSCITPCSPACSTASCPPERSATTPRSTDVVVVAPIASTRNRVPSTDSSPAPVTTWNWPWPGATSSSTAPSTRTLRGPSTVSLPPGPSSAVEPSASVIVSAALALATPSGAAPPPPPPGRSPPRLATTIAPAAAATRPQPAIATGDRPRATLPWRVTSRVRIRARASALGAAGSEPASSVVRFWSSTSSSRSRSVVMAAPR
jgi:hypothetical protein